MVYFDMSPVIVNVPKAPQPFGVHGALGNAFAVLVRELLDELIILHEKRAARTSGDRVLVVGDRRAGGGGQDWTFGHWILVTSDL